MPVRRRMPLRPRRGSPCEPPPIVRRASVPTPRRPGSSTRRSRSRPTPATRADLLLAKGLAHRTSPGPQDAGRGAASGRRSTRTRRARRSTAPAERRRPSGSSSSTPAASTEAIDELERARARHDEEQATMRAGIEASLVAGLHARGTRGRRHRCGRQGARVVAERCGLVGVVARGVRQQGLGSCRTLDRGAKARRSSARPSRSPRRSATWSSRSGLGTILPRRSGRTIRRERRRSRDRGTSSDAGSGVGRMPIGSPG